MCQRGHDRRRCTCGRRVHRHRFARAVAGAGATSGPRRHGRPRARRRARAELHPLTPGSRTGRAALGADRADRARPRRPSLSTGRDWRRGQSPQRRARRLDLQHAGRDRAPLGVPPAAAGAPGRCGGAVGRDRIAHLAGPPSQTTMADRARGYTEEMASRTTDIVESNGTPEDGYARLRERFERNPPPDAVFAATDRLAVAALAVAADRHLHVPDDVAIVGFDDIQLATQLRPSLSSVSQPAYELGTVAVDMAQRLAAGEAVQPKVLLPRLVERESTLGPGGRYT
ncbi:MAG TPA: substrate-binding domain-containing protein [Chloroflexota bacterium]|nr:substrate-binding domain-containing protein [Chloroflexota bacterium]